MLQLSAVNIFSGTRATPPTSITPHSNLKSMVRGLASLGSMVGSMITILFLFTKSDIKTILIPVTVFAALSQPNANPERLAVAMFWTWAQLLQLCVANQIINPAEDLRNKPWRPVSSKRIALKHALVLRWSLVPICLIHSYALGVPWQGLSLSLAGVLYNELGLGNHWLFKVLCNVWGYASFNTGAARVLSETNHSLGTIVVNSLIILTTVHAQDFCDETGDRLDGRRTLPIVWPEASRVLTLITTPAWTFALLSISVVNHFYAAAFIGLGFLVGMRFYFHRDVNSDRLSYIYYNAWLTIAQVIHTPLIMRVLS